MLSKANSNNKYDSTYIKKKSINKHNRSYRRREWIASGESTSGGKGTKHLVRKWNNSMTELGLIDHESSYNNDPIFEHWDHKQKQNNNWQCQRCHHANGPKNRRCKNCNASIKKQDPTKHYIYDQRKSKKNAIPLNIVEKPKKKKRKRKKKRVKKNNKSDNFAQYWDTMKQHNDATKSLMEKQRTDYTQCNFEIRVIDIVMDKAEIDKLLKLTNAKTFRIPIQLNTKYQKINNRLMILFITSKDIFDYSDTDNIEKLFSAKAYNLVNNVQLLDVAKHKLRQVIEKIPKLYELLSWHKHDWSKNMLLNFGELINLDAFEISKRYQKVMKKYNYSNSIKTKLTFTLLEYSEREWIEEKAESIYDKTYMFNVPMKLKNMILLSCCVEMNINDKKQSFHLQTEVGTGSRHQVPIYCCEYNHKVMVDERLNNDSLFDGAKEIILQLIDFSSCWISRRNINLDFHSMHEPVYEPLKCDLKTLLIEYIPFIDIVKYVLFEYVGYDTASYIVLNGDIMFGSYGTIVVKHEHEETTLFSSEAIGKLTRKDMAQWGTKDTRDQPGYSSSSSWSINIWGVDTTSESTSTSSD